MRLFLVAAVGFLVVLAITYIHLRIANPRFVLRKKFRQEGRTTCLSDILALDGLERGTILICRSVRLYFWVPETLNECANLPANAVLLDGESESSIGRLSRDTDNQLNIIEMEEVAECIDSS